MRLALSSAAAPPAALGELLEAASRRGLTAVELVEGHGHGLDPGLSDSRETLDAADRAEAAGVAIAAYRLSSPSPDPGTDDFMCLVRFARALDVPLMVPLPNEMEESAANDLTRCGAVLDALRSEGVAAMPVLTGGASALRMLDVLGAVSTAGAADLLFAWDADPASEGLAGTGSALLERAGARLRYVTLRGGGPESTEQTGRGVGSLMAHLALSGYTGTLTLAPSSERYHVIWDAWLGRRGGWGCGSRSEDRTLVTLGGAT
jgi:hypothetical protein